MKLYAAAARLLALNCHAIFNIYNVFIVSQYSYTILEKLERTWDSSFCGEILAALVVNKNLLCCTRVLCDFLKQLFPGVCNIRRDWASSWLWQNTGFDLHVLARFIELVSCRFRLHGLIEIKSMSNNYQEGGGGLKNEPHVEKYYIVPSDNKGKSSFDPLLISQKFWPASPLYLHLSVPEFTIYFVL